MTEIEGTFSGKIEGTIELPEAPPPDNVEESYHWYRDGKGMSILVRDQKLNQYMTPDRPGETIQGIYRSGLLFGKFQLPKGQPVQDGKLVIRFQGIPWKFPGLHSWGPGSCWYHNDSNYDLLTGEAVFEEYALGKYEMRFYFADPDDSGKKKLLQNNYPTNWQKEGLHLSWVVPIA
jgi:hypothetical protein